MAGADGALRLCVTRAESCAPRSHAPAAAAAAVEAEQRLAEQAKAEEQLPVCCSRRCCVAPPGVCATARLAGPDRTKRRHRRARSIPRPPGQLRGAAPAGGGRKGWAEEKEGWWRERRGEKAKRQLPLKPSPYSSQGKESRHGAPPPNP